MKSDHSSSRTLRLRLLAAMITSLLVVLAICAALFNTTYQQAIKVVLEHSEQLAFNTSYNLSHSYCQALYAHLTDLVNGFCSQTVTEINAYKIQFNSTEDLAGYAAMHSGEYYYDMVFGNESVFFVYDGTELKSYRFDTSVREYGGSSVINADQEMEKALTTLTKHMHYSENAPYYEDYTDFMSYLHEFRTEPCGYYMIEDEGCLICWNNLQNFGGPDLCVGSLIDNSNAWLTVATGLADEESADLITDMESLFRKNLYIMLAAAGGILLFFILMSVILSKKIADPVVYEHNMLIQLNEMKTAFLSNVSHELKTPLAAMSGYAQNAELELIKGGDAPKIQEQLKRISSEANRMALMVTQVLDVTRIEEGRMVLDMAPCDLEAIVRETAETYFAVLNKNNNRLALRIPLDIPQVKGDSSRLQRVFVNLISNAMKHTHDGVILVKAEQEGDQIKVMVKDNGSGISPEDMPHIWERYYMGSHAETGTGLGLFICKFIIESHGGKIWAESEPGQGTTFQFTLPVA